MSNKVVLITRNTIEDKTTRKEVEADAVNLVSQDLHGSVGDALIGGEWVRVFKTHIDGPYTDWQKETVID